MKKCKNITTVFLLQGTSAHPQMVPIGENVPSLPIGQSMSMSNMSISQSGGGHVGQAFLQPTTMVPQVAVKTVTYQ